MPLIVEWFRAFVWTLLLEQVAGWLVLRGAVPRTRRLSVIAIANVASHPAVWLIFPEVGAELGWSHGLTLLVSEVWALGLEAWIYWLLLGTTRLRLALATSLAANGLSFAAGYGLRALGWL